MADPTSVPLRRSAPAVARNRDAILTILARILPRTGTVIEIASGTGEHACHFARALPGLQWQPSERDAPSRGSIEAWRRAVGLPNVLAPVAIDVCDPGWHAASDMHSVDAIVCINMLHISPWRATDALFRGASLRLRTGSRLYLYGPFLRDDHPTAASNTAFDLQLHARDPRWGIRALERVQDVATRHHFVLSEVVEMPANNLSVIFTRC